ncbi:hypothetical protein [Nostoc sp.]|uniref:hypothetical protein n=1 Tax=Nostoc sp. TaxID=1180 RepID=UPI002FF5B552
MKNPPVLVLDEATLAVDNEIEAAIWRSLERITVDPLIMVEEFLLTVFFPILACTKLSSDRSLLIFLSKLFFGRY